MHFNPVKVSLVAFAILFKIHSAYCEALFIVDFAYHGFWLPPKNAMNKDPLYNICVNLEVFIGLCDLGIDRVQS